jgi:hypothetical protein
MTRRNKRAAGANGMKMRGHRAIAANRGLSESAWFDRLKRYDYSWLEVGSHGTYPGSCVLAEVSSLDHREGLIQQEKRAGKQRAARARWDQSSGSNVPSRQFCATG